VKSYDMQTWMAGLRNLLHAGVHPPPGASPVPPWRGNHRPSLSDQFAGGAASHPLSTPTPLNIEPTLRLHLFGSVRAYVSDRVAIDERFTRRKAKALLVLLYLERGRYVTKEELLERLWPELDVPADSGRLKQTVLVLRHALEGDRSRRTGWRYILERDGSYYFNTQVSYGSDLEDFERELSHARAAQQQGDDARARAHFECAFALHRAELLPEFRYDDWAAGEISHMRELYLQALEDAAQLHGEHGEYARAIELLQRATYQDPLRETSALQLMAWLWRRGDRAEALRVYRRLRDQLAARLELEPGPQVSALYEAIRRGRATGLPREPGLSAAS
jgi:DNA-binding SARP family transcriptional activator